MFTITLLIVVVLGYPDTARGQASNVGDLCTLKSGNQGTCRLLYDCNKAIQDLKKQIFPQTCGFQGKEPIVCCDSYAAAEAVSVVNSQSKTETIAQKKCKKYAEYVFTITSGPLLIPSEVKVDECGIGITPLIVGGIAANRKEFPHMAILGYEKDSKEIDWICGGALISENFVLTAAYCLQTRLLGPPKFVKLGTTDLNEETKIQQTVQIAESIRHPKYKSSSHYYDIGLVKLSTPARISGYVRPACLHTQKHIAKEKLVVSGWDMLGLRNDKQTLCRNFVRLIDHDNCNSSYKHQIGRRIRNGIIDDTQLCAGPENVNFDCQPTSGSPLQIYHPSEDAYCMYDIVGITSFGKTNFKMTSPTVYTRVSHFIEWIESIVWRDM